MVSIVVYNSLSYYLTGVNIIKSVKRQRTQTNLRSTTYLINKCDDGTITVSSNLSLSMTYKDMYETHHDHYYNNTVNSYTTVSTSVTDFLSITK